MFGGDKAKARKVASLHQDVRALQTAQVAAEAEYDRVLGRNREVRRGCIKSLRLVVAGIGAQGSGCKAGSGLPCSATM